MGSSCFMFPHCFWFVFVLLQIQWGVSEKLVDLTWGFNSETIYWKGVQPFNYTKILAAKNEGQWYASNEFQSGEHGGTHLDAPYHFSEKGWKVTDIPIERFFVNAILLDFSRDVAVAGSDYLIDPKVFEEKLKTFEPIPNNTVLLIKYGWSKYWPDREKYMGEDDNGTFHFPGLDNRTASIIVSYKNIIGVGIDTASGDAGISKTFDVHKILLGNNLYILENTKLNEDLPDKVFRLIVAPMKLEKGTGAPVRIFALLNEN